MKINTPLLTAEQLDAGHIEQHTDHVTIRCTEPGGHYRVQRSVLHKKGAASYNVTRGDVALQVARDAAVRMEEGRLVA